MSPAKIWSCLLSAAGTLVPGVLVLGVLVPGVCTAQPTAPDVGACYLTMQIPNATNVTATSINDAEVIAGEYVSTSPSSVTSLHGFVRNVHGTITSFDPAASVATTTTGINGGGSILGNYSDKNGAIHGFLRGAQGAITSFDAPGGANSDTFPKSINNAGSITGFTGSVLFSFLIVPAHGFVRDASGDYTVFDPTGSSSTSPVGINAAGTITGSYLGADSMNHGFLRSATGTITSFDYPGAGATIPAAINDAGTIAGTWSTSSGNHAFLRTSDGKFTSFDIPASLGNFTSVSGMNNSGVVVGFYEDANNAVHGYIRAANGTFTLLNVPGGSNTGPAGLNDFGIVIGSYETATPNSFLRVPFCGQQFEAGTYSVADAQGLLVDGGFYLYGDPIVRLWPYVAGNLNQHWQFRAVSGGFTLFDLGTGRYASDHAGNLYEGQQQDVWTVVPVLGGYSIQNNRTAGLLKDPGTQDGAVTVDVTGSVWQLSPPR